MERQAQVQGVNKEMVLFALDHSIQTCERWLKGMQNAIDLQTKNSEEIDHHYNGYESVFEGETSNKSPSPWDSCKSLENELKVVLKSPKLGKEVKTTQIAETNESHNTQQNIDHPRRIRRRTSLRTRDLEVLQTRNEIAALAAQEEIFKDTDCGICLLDLDDGQTLHELQTCRHVFHLSCMNECLTSRTNRRVCMKCFVAIPEEECKQICTLARSDKREARIALREQKTQQPRLIEEHIEDAYAARSLEDDDIQVDQSLTVDDSEDEKNEHVPTVIENREDSVLLGLTTPLQIESQTKEDQPQRSRTIEVQMSQTDESISPITPGSSQIPQDCYGSMIQKMRKRKLDSQESQSPNKARKTNEDQVVHISPSGTPPISLNDGTMQGAQKDDSVSSSLTYTEEITGRQDLSFDLDIPEERETPIAFDLETKVDLNVSFSSIDTSPPVTGASKEEPYDLKALYGNESDYDPFDYASDANTSQPRKVKSSIPTESSPDYSYLLTLPMFPRHPDS